MPLYKFGPNDIFDNQLSQDQIQMTEILINHFDDKFKHHLDRYKYSTRYKENNRNFHRKACLKTLIDLETNISGVFAAGDIVRGASLVVWAIKDGREV